MIDDTIPPVLLVGGTVIDGTGGDPFRADVLLEQGRIAAIGLRGGRGHRDADVVDAAGLALVPGFIDAHSHADASPFIAEDLSKISQGVTTEVIGNCGFSLAPIARGGEAVFAELSSRLFPSVPFDWHTTAELLALTDQLGSTTHRVPLVGHHALRTSVVGLDDVPVDEHGLEQMRALLQEALGAGVFGLSTGLIYPPGMFASTAELAAVASVLPPDGIYATHLRSETAELVPAVAEAIAIAEAAGCRLQVSHLKAAGRRSWGDVVPAMALLDDAADRGMTVHHDVYPYTANSTMLASCLPPWFHAGGREETIRLLEEPAALARAEAELSVDNGGWDNWVASCGWANVLVASTATHRDEGLTLVEAARRRRASPFEALVAILRENTLRATMSVFAMDEADVCAVLQHPRAVVGSDGLPRGTGGRPHPRLFGTFTRVLHRYVRELSVLDLPEAIAMMTSRPARAFGLPDRGQINVGAAADVVLLDPERVRDRATFTEPELLSEGIEHVFVNGRATYTRAGLIAAPRGRRLTPSRSADQIRKRRR